MRLLLVGSNQPWAIEKFYIKHLKELNPETELFPAQNILHNYLNESFFNKITFRFGLSDIYYKINLKLKNFVEEFKPDVIWVFKGMEIFPETLIYFKKKKIRLVNYNPDHPFIKSSSGSWNKNVFKSIGLYDLHFCYSKMLMKRINEEYNIKTVWLPFGFELDDEIYNNVISQPEINRVCFLGNPDKIRAEIINFLAENGINLDVYGHNWNKYLRSKKKNFNIFDAVYGNKFWEILRKYRIQLNIFRPHNIGSHNMRTFEIPAVGGIQLAPDSPEHRFFFNSDKEIFLYKNNNDLLTKVKFLSELSDSDVILIRDAARKKSLTADYSYKTRAKNSLDSIKEII